MSHAIRYERVASELCSAFPLSLEPRFCRAIAALLNIEERTPSRLISARKFLKAINNRQIECARRQNEASRAPAAAVAADDVATERTNVYVFAPSAGTSVASKTASTRARDTRVVCVRAPQSACERVHRHEL